MSHVHSLARRSLNWAARALPAQRMCRRAYSSSAVGTGTALPSLHTFTEEEQMLRDVARRFATERVKPLVSSMDEKEKMDRGLIKEMFDCGLMGIEVPTEYGGAGASFTSAIIVVEELSRVDPSVGVCCDVHNTLAVAMLNLHGNEEQKKEYLEPMATRSLASFCLSEADAGSDAFALKARATKDPAAGGDYVLDGQKMWITNSGEAELFVIFANAAPEKKHRGITAFIVPRDTPGLEVGKPERKLGIRASSTCVVSFDKMRVPARSVLGEVGLGYRYAIEILNEGRIGIAAQMLGLAQGAMDAAMPYLFERKQFGAPIGTFQGIEHQFAQLATEIEAARLMTYNAARIKDAGGDVSFVKEAAMAKLFASQVADRVASRCVELMGGVGFTRDVPVEKFYRDCKIGAIYEGTSNIQLQTIAKIVRKPYYDKSGK